MKIGDKVRFLSAVGGGVVTGFQSKEIALVEEEDGFETPVLIRECVVIDSVERKYEQEPKMKENKPAVPQKAEPVSVTKAADSYVYEELPGGEQLSLYVAYLPEDTKRLGQGVYETYLINDSNYFLHCNYMMQENQAWRSVFCGELAPNTKLFVEEFTALDLNDKERLCVQALAFKKDKPYAFKLPYTVELRLQTVKFYKLHCFVENNFFDEPALVYPLIEKDQAHKEMLVNASDLQEALLQKKQEDKPKERRTRIVEKPQIEEVDLHASALLETTAGMDNAAILEYQLQHLREVMQRLANKKGQRVVFIHGKGDGVLRQAVLKELQQHYKRCRYQDASFKEYGYGATLVTIY